MSRTLHLLLSGIALFGLWSCSGEESSDTLDATNPTNDTLSVEVLDRITKTQKIFYSIPSPIEMATLLKKTGARYDYTYLNDPVSSDAFNTTTKQALNLGIYGADLSYTSIYNESGESILYMKATRTLADKLNVSAAIDDRLAERIEQNIEIQDSMITLISEVYWNLDGYLKEGDRNYISALMVAGGWTEGLYLTTRLLDQSPQSPEVRTHLAEQKQALKNLVSLLEQYESEKNIAVTLSDMRSLDTIFDQVEVNLQASTPIKDPETGVTDFGGSNEIVMTDEVLNQIRVKTEEIRGRMIQQN